MTDPRSAAFFDLDKTIIARSSVLAMSRSFYTGGLLNRRAVVRSAFNQLLFALRGADHAQMERARRQLSVLTAGWEVQQVRDIIAGALQELIGPMVYAEAVALIAEHRAAGRDVVIVSTAGDEIVQPIGELLGVDRVIASRMVEHEGHWTGAVSYYAYGPTKATAIEEMALREGYDLAQCYAYSDSATDLPMLLAVGHPVVVNPDRVLRREAVRRNWPVRIFERPVDLGRRVPRPTPLVAAFVALASGTAVALVVGARRHGWTRGDLLGRRVNTDR